jgi:hypothetical protein
MEELIEKFGAEQWKESVEKAGIPEGRTFTAFCDVDETEFTRIMTGVAEMTFQSMEQVTEAVGEHGSTVYAPNVHAAYYSGVRRRASYWSTSTTSTRS